MKKILALFLLLVISLPGFAVEQNSYDGEFTPRSRNHEDVFVRNVQGATLSSGEIVVYSTNGPDGIRVQYGTTEGAIGACVMLESCLDGKLCKCRRRGYVDGLKFDGVATDAVAGAPIFLGANLGLAVGISTANQSSDDYPLGVFLEAQASSAGTKAYFRGL